MQCIWAGRVKIKVEVSEDGKKAIEKEVIFGKTKGDETENHDLYSSENYTLTAMMVTPYPDSNNNDDEKRAYALLVSEAGKK